MACAASEAAQALLRGAVVTATRLRIVKVGFWVLGLPGPPKCPVIEPLWSLIVHSWGVLVGFSLYRD